MAHPVSLVQCPDSAPHSKKMPGSPWLFLFSLLLDLLHSTLSSPCQEVVDTGGSIYKVEDQMDADSQTCQTGSFVFTMGGKRFCFTEEQEDESVFSNVRCKEGPPSTLPTAPPLPPLGPECQTPACKRFSERVLSAMDLSIDPCQDFHKFACGKYKGKFSSNDLTSIMVANLKEILRDPPNPSNPKYDSWEQSIR